MQVPQLECWSSWSRGWPITSFEHYMQAPHHLPQNALHPVPRAQLQSLLIRLRKRHLESSHHWDFENDKFICGDQLSITSNYGKHIYRGKVHVRVFGEYLLKCNSPFAKRLWRCTLGSMYSSLNLCWYLTESLVSKSNLFHKQTFHRMKCKYKKLLNMTDWVLSYFNLDLSNEYLTIW